MIVEAFRGYQASKKRYFYDLKIHLMVTRHGQPVDFFLTPGGFSGTSDLELFDFALSLTTWASPTRPTTAT